MTVEIAPSQSSRRAHTGARWTDLTWVTRRQHRWLVGVTAVGAAALAGYLLSLEANYASLVFRCGATCTGDLSRQYMSLQSAARTVVPLMLPALTAFIAVFWGAPLVSREFEQRTHLVAWTQDVTPTRWLVSKLALLGSSAMMLAAGVGFAAHGLLRQIEAVAAMAPSPIVSDEFSPFSGVAFESWPPLQAAYVLFGFVLGVTAGLLTRRSVLSMGVTLVGFLTVRIAIAVWVRPAYLPPLRNIYGISKGMGATDQFIVDTGYLDAAGKVVPAPMDCIGVVFADCARGHGIVNQFVDSQPNSRIPLFHLIELGIYGVLIAALLVIIWRWLRKATTI